MKTRLIPHLGKHGATQLYKRLLNRLALKLMSEKLADIELWCMPDTSHPEFQHIKSILGCSLFEQVGYDLGARMSFAAKRALQHYQHVILIGVDCPELTMRQIQQVICCLNDGVDAILAPAEDGGYVLLGLNQVADCLFDRVPWGTEKVAETTRECFRSMGWEWLELPELWDIDRPEDLFRLNKLPRGYKPGEFSP